MQNPVVGGSLGIIRKCKKASNQAQNIGNKLVCRAGERPSETLNVMQMLLSISLRPKQLSKF